MDSAYLAMTHVACLLRLAFASAFVLANHYFIPSGIDFWPNCTPEIICPVLVTYHEDAQTFSICKNMLSLLSSRKFTTREGYL